MVPNYPRPSFARRVEVGHLAYNEIMITSEQLIVNDLYSRNDLMSQFEITDATINTGIFQPAGTSSIWLFITEEKSSDRTQYEDHLEGNELFWEGQSSGRKDKLILEHSLNRLELLVFYRHTKSEYPEYAFKYEGAFQYRSHIPGNPETKEPSRFILDRCV